MRDDLEVQLKLVVRYHAMVTLADRDAFLTEAFKELCSYGRTASTGSWLKVIEQIGLDSFIAR